MYFILFLIFLTTISFFWLIYLIFFQTRDQIKKRLEQQNERGASTETEDTEEHTSIRDRLYRSFITTSYYKKQIKLLSRAYIRMKPEELMSISFLLGTALALSAFLFQDSILASILTFFIGILVPRGVLTVVAARRAKQMNAQLPQALSLISNGLRAGFSFNQALGVVSREMEAPIGEEFGRILNENQLGKPIDEVLSEFEERTDDEDMSIFITTVLTQIEVGGNLAEILDIIANTIRERTELRGEINTLTSQSKLSAVVIGILPVALAVVIYLVNPEYMSVLFTEPIGLLMLAAAGIMMFMGIIALYNIVNIEI